MTEPVLQLTGYEIGLLSRKWDKQLKAAKSKAALRDVIQEYEQDCAARNLNQQKRSLGHAYLLWRWRYMHKSGTPGRKATKGRKVPNHD